MSIKGYMTDAANDAALMVSNARASGFAGGFPGGVGGGGHGLNMGVGGSGAQMAQHEEQLRHYRGNVYAIIRCIANRIAGQTVHVARREGAGGLRAGGRPWVKAAPRGMRSALGTSELVPHHPLLEMIRDPNPIMVQWTLWFFTVASLEITGKAFWWLRHDKDTGRREIWPIPSPWMTPKHTDAALFAQWTVRPTQGIGAAMTLPAEEVVYFYYPDPANPLGALSPLQALAPTVFADESIEESQRRAFLNGTNPGLALTVGRLPEQGGVGNDLPPVLTKAQRDTLINTVKRHYRGVVNNEEPMILDGLIKDVHKINNTPREMDYGESSVLTKAKLAQGWGVNPISMGEIGSNRAESAVADDHLIANCVGPRCEMISQVLTAWVVPRITPGEDLIAWIEVPVAVDLDYDLAVETAMMDRGTMSRNEWRARHNLPPIRGGDTAITAVGDVPIVLDDGSGDADPPPAAGARAVLLRAFDEGYEVQLNRHHRDIKAAAVRSLSTLAEAVAHRAADSLPVSATMGEGTIAGFFGSEWETTLRGDMEPHVRAAVAAGAAVEWSRHLIAHAGQKSAGALPGTLAARVLRMANKLVSAASWGAVLKSLAATVKRFADALVGKSPGEVVREALSDTTINAAAEGIAATEAPSAMQAGGQAARDHIASTGVKIRKQWVTTGKPNVRQAHRDCNGQIVPHEQAFLVGGVRAWFPGDPDLPPELRCNCRCQVRTLYPGDR